MQLCIRARLYAQMKTHVYTDPILIIIGLLLLASLLTFFSGLIPYPYGILVLTIFFVARLLSLQKPYSDKT